MRSKKSPSTLTSRTLGRGLFVIPLLLALLAAAASAAPADTVEPYLVKDINPGSESSLPERWNLGLTDMGGIVFFAAEDGTHGEELWRSDGTKAGTYLVKDINPSDSSFPKGLIELDGTLFFAADDGKHGVELWKSDGSKTGTVLVKDINPLGKDGLGWLCCGLSRTSMNGALFFAADDGVHGDELWKTDGTEAGTVLVKDICPGEDGSWLRALTEFKGSLYFGANDASYPFKSYPWKSDGTDTGTVLLRDNKGRLFSDVMSFLAMDDGLLIAVEDGIVDSGECDAELWRTDGTEAGTGLVKELAYGTESDPCMRDLTNVGGDALFMTRADDNACGEHVLWRTDGTREGTQLIREFLCDDEGGEALWVGMGDSLLFSADEGIHGDELWRSDGSGTGTSLVKDIKPGDRPSAPSGGASIGGTLFFAADNGTNGRELWQSDGTEATTTLVGDINPGDRDALPSWYDNYSTTIHSVGPTLFFWANEGTHGFELWALDTGTCSSPEKPILVDPTDYSSTCDGTPEFDWEPASRAQEYQIRIADGDTSSIVLQTETRGTDFRPATPLSPGTYFWRVRASNDCDWSAWSEKWWFTIEPPPPVPTLYSPVDGSRTYATRPNFEWSETQGANRYRLKVDDDAGFASAVIDKTQSGTSHRPSKALLPGTYYWKVRGLYDCGNGAWSEPHSLTILPTGLEYDAYLPLVTRGAR